MNPPAAITFREYTPEDQEICLSLFESNRPKYFAEEERPGFIEWLEKPDRPSYSIMERAGELVGCGGIFHDPDHNQCGLAWGMIRGDLHGQGFGKRMTLYRMAQMDIHFPDCEQRLSTAQHTFGFYEKLGFKITSIEPNGWGYGFDKYVMVKPATRQNA